MKYWILKSDPDTYSIDDLRSDKETDWDGVRNYQARNNIRQMNPGDFAFIYHSLNEKEIIGSAEVISEAFIDQADNSDTWSAVRIRFIEKYDKPLSLKAIKASEKLNQIGLVKQSRLSVIPITYENYCDIIELVKM